MSDTLHIYYRTYWHFLFISVYDYSFKFRRLYSERIYLIRAIVDFFIIKHIKKFFI